MEAPSTDAVQAAGEATDPHHPAEECCRLAQEQDWLVAEVDEELLDARLKDWLPERIFDAHAHLWRLNDFQPPESAPQLFRSAPIAEASWDDYCEFVVKKLHGA